MDSVPFRVQARQAIAPGVTCSSRTLWEEFVERITNLCHELKISEMRMDSVPFRVQARQANAPGVTCSSRTLWEEFVQRLLVVTRDPNWT